MPLEAMGLMEQGGGAGATGEGDHQEACGWLPWRGKKNPPTRAQGCGTAALAQPLCRVTRSSTAAVACGLHNCAPPQRDPSPMGTTHRCSGWTEDLHLHRGWAPEVA
jgi:hypothetical protein